MACVDNGGLVKEDNVGVGWEIWMLDSWAIFVGTAGTAFI